MHLFQLNSEDFFLLVVGGERDVLISTFSEVSFL